MESIYTELALYDSKNECARSDTVFLPISEVCHGKVSLEPMPPGSSPSEKEWHQFFSSRILFFSKQAIFQISLGNVYNHLHMTITSP